MHMDKKTPQQAGVVLWLTGLSGAGKTTIAMALEDRLRREGRLVERLDGDVVRQSLSRDLGFSKEDRDRNIERVTFVAKLLARNGVVTLVSFISPYRKHREQARQEIDNFVEVHVHCPLDVCEARDVKGLYAKARAGELTNFTGIDDPYEDPESPEVIISTHEVTLDEGVEQLYQVLKERGVV